MARTRRHRGPVPGHPAAEAGLAARHARPQLDDRKVERSSTPARTSRPRGRALDRDPGQRRRPRWLPSRPRQVGRDRPARCRRLGRVPVSGARCPAVQAQSPNRAVTVTAQAALNGADGIGALVHVVDPTDSLRQTPERPVGRDARRPASRRCCARTTSRSASSPTAAGGAWSAPAKARWRRPASSTP